jgi:nitrogen fixation protein NifU and related proteins
LMTEAVKGRPLAEAKRLSAAMRELLTSESAPTEAAQAGLGKLAALEGVRRFPSRIKCAMLGWHALDECLNGAAEPNSPPTDTSNANLHHPQA